MAPFARAFCRWSWRPTCMPSRTASPDLPVLSRFTEVSRLLTGDPDALAEDGIRWLKKLCEDLQHRAPGCYGVTRADFPAIIAQSGEVQQHERQPHRADRRRTGRDPGSSPVKQFGCTGVKLCQTGQRAVSTLTPYYRSRQNDKKEDHDQPGRGSHPVGSRGGGAARPQQAGSADARAGRRRAERAVQGQAPGDL